MKSTLVVGIWFVRGPAADSLLNISGLGRQLKGSRPSIKLGAVSSGVDPIPDRPRAFPEQGRSKVTDDGQNR